MIACWFLRALAYHQKCLHFMIYLARCLPATILGWSPFSAFLDVIAVYGSGIVRQVRSVCLPEQQKCE